MQWKTRVSQELSYKIELVNGKAVLPTGTAPWNFAEWHDAEEKIKQFKKRVVGRKVRQRERVSVELALIHRPDNDYNSNAISVAAPEHYGGDRDQRFFGYLYESQLRRIGRTRLADLATALGGAELSCTGAVTYYGLELDLPEPAELAKAIDLFLGYTDKKNHTSPSQETNNALKILESFTTEFIPVSELQFATRYSEVGRVIELRDSNSLRLVGMIDRGNLFLQDERDRNDVLRLLRDASLPVAAPLATQAIPLNAEWPVTRIPNLHMDARQGEYRFPPTSPLARYNPRTGKLWLEDSRLVGPALCYVSRVGLKVNDLGVSRRPWKLTEDLPFDEFNQDPSGERLEKRRYRAAEQIARRLMASIEASDLVDVIPPAEIELRTYEIARGTIVEPKKLFRLHESFIVQRYQLFGSHTLADESGECRLCGQPALPINTDLALEPLCYCHQCLEFASKGFLLERSRAATSLRLIAESEFNGEPMLEEQLETLHLDPRLPVEPTVIDRLLLLRFAIKRRKFAWTRLLEEAGLAEGGLRLSRGTLIRARDGHRCLSLGEKAVCDFLHQFGIEHEREPVYPIDSFLNPLGRRRADWVLSDGTFVELWGLPKNPEYAAKMQEKRLLAEAHGLPLLELTERDLAVLPVAFAPWLPASTPTTTAWRWTPRLDSAPAMPREPRQTETPLGRNAFNSDLRAARLERCRTALELQTSGLARRQIAEKLGVGPDTVKTLLRDAKFFADPTSDEERLQRARAAAAAQRSGQTKEKFESHSGLTRPKVNEAWKDADVIESN